MIIIAWRGKLMISAINKYVLGVVTPWLLILSGVYFSVRLAPFFLSKPKKLAAAFAGSGRADGISPFRALTLALAGTLGVGNIVGVASAIILGGYGSVLWMWVSALVAMVLKYAEILLAVRHRRVRGDGTLYGGAPYYIRDLFMSVGADVCGRVTAAVFAAFCLLDSLSMGCIVQVNAVSSAFSGVFGIKPWVIGVGMAVLALFVILGDARWISGFTEKSVPIMTLAYVIISAAAIFLCREWIGDAFALIIRDAFSPESMAGGILGFFASGGLRYGVMRGLMSNEAGCGTAPISHASSDTDQPARQGVWGMLEVFVDTILLCTLTALVIILSGKDPAMYANDPMMLTVDAYSEILGDGAGYAICVLVLFFGLATIICWAHYGKESLGYFTRRRWAVGIFLAVYILCIVVGAVCAPAFAWEAADIAIGVMTVINLLMLFLMRREIIDESRKYFLGKKLKVKR